MCKIVEITRKKERTQQGGFPVNSANRIDEIKALKDKITYLERENSSLKKSLSVYSETETYPLEFAKLNHEIYVKAEDGMIVFDKKGTILEINPSLNKALKWKKDDIIGYPLTYFVPERFKQKLANVNKIMEKNKKIKEILPVKKQDGLIYFECSVNQLSNGNYFAILRDISDKRVLKRKILEKEDLFKDLFLETLDGIVFWGSGGKIINANNATCKIIGLSLEELLTHRINDFIDPNDKKYWEMKKELKEKGAMKENVHCIFPNGKKKLIEFTVKLNAVDGYHMTIFRDVSERNLMEQELRKSEEKFRKIFLGSFEGMILGMIVARTLK